MSLRTILLSVIAVILWAMDGAKPLGILCIGFFCFMLYVDDMIKDWQKKEADEKFRKWQDDHDRRFKKGKYAVSTSSKKTAYDQRMKQKEEQLKTLTDLSRKEGYEYLAKAVSQMEKEIEAEKKEQK